MGAVPVGDGPPRIAGIAARSDPYGKLRGEGLGDDRVQFVIADLRQLIQRARVAVAADELQPGDHWQACAHRRSGRPRPTRDHAACAVDDLPRVSFMTAPAPSGPDAPPVAPR